MNQRLEDVPWGHLFDLAAEAADEIAINFNAPDVEQMLQSSGDGIEPFPEWWLDSFPPAAGIPKAAQYLTARKVPKKIADFLDLRFDSHRNRLCFPVRDFAGRLAGLHGRTILPNGDPRYLMYLYHGRSNPVVWLGEQWVDFAKPVVMVEGPFDLARVLEIYPNTVSPLFASPSKAKMMRMVDAFEIVTLYDRGAGGDTARRKTEAVLSPQCVVSHAMLPEGIKDPGECDLAVLDRIIRKHTIFSL